MRERPSGERRDVEGHADDRQQAEQLRAALLAYRASAAGKAKNLLVPKPKPTEAAQRPGQRRRKPLPAAKRKSRNA